MSKVRRVTDFGLCRNVFKRQSTLTINIQMIKTEKCLQVGMPPLLFSRLRRVVPVTVSQLDMDEINIIVYLRHRWDIAHCLPRGEWCIESGIPAQFHASLQGKSSLLCSADSAETHSHITNFMAGPIQFTEDSTSLFLIVKK